MIYILYSYGWGDFSYHKTEKSAKLRIKNLKKSHPDRVFSLMVKYWHI